MTAQPTLVILCRRPALGVGKQRLASALGAACARDVGLALLDCALEDAAQWPGPVVLAPAEHSDATWATTLLDRDAAVIPQSGGNLGERLNGVDGTLRAQGHGQIVYIGSDAPAHTAQLYARVCGALNGADAVLVPALDGGVTLMGARRAWPMLTDLPWSTPALGAALSIVCEDGQMSVSQISSSFDVDAAPDLQRATHALADDPRPARRRLLALIDALAMERAR